MENKEAYREMGYLTAPPRMCVIIEDSNEMESKPRMTKKQRIKQRRMAFWVNLGDGFLSIIGWGIIGVLLIFSWACYAVAILLFVSALCKM